MRSLVHSVVLIVLIRSAATVVMVHAQAPLFRSGIELLEVDASVVSSTTGTLVTDLQAGDFTVLVDGKPRQVVSAEYVSDLFQRAGRPNDAPDASISTNQDHRRGRLIVLALDQNNMTIGRVRAMSSAAGRFIDGLDPADQVALYGFPMPGPAVDFTTDHEAVKRELGALRGYTSADRLQFNIADHEAFLFDLRAEICLRRRKSRTTYDTKDRHARLDNVFAVVRVRTGSKQRRDRLGLTRRQAGAAARRHDRRQAPRAICVPGRDDLGNHPSHRGADHVGIADAERIHEAYGIRRHLVECVGGVDRFPS